MPKSIPKEPGVHFLDHPITKRAGWTVALHVDTDGKPICCVMVAPEHAGPAFVEDSLAWWEAHKNPPTGPHPTTFSAPHLHLMPRTKRKA